MKKILQYCLIYVSLGLTVQAQNFGSLTGYVKDAKTGEPLIGATVQLDGTTRGGETDLDGYCSNFIFINCLFSSSAMF